MVPIVSDPEPAALTAALTPILLVPAFSCSVKDAMAICPRMPTEIMVLNYTLSLMKKRRHTIKFL